MLACVERERIALVLGDPRRLRRELLALGPLAPLVSVALGAAQVVVAPIPGQAIGLANGFLYGPYLGTAISMAGLAIGSAFAMGLARAFGRPLVLRFVEAATLERIDRAMAGRGPLFFFLVFLVPMLPDDLACFVIGLSALPLGRMLVLAVLGRLPGTFAACVVGARAGAIPEAAIVALGVLTIVAALVFSRYATRFEDVVLRRLSRAEREKPEE